MKAQTLSFIKELNNLGSQYDVSIKNLKEIYNFIKIKKKY